MYILCRGSPFQRPPLVLHLSRMALILLFPSEPRPLQLSRLPPSPSPRPPPAPSVAEQHLALTPGLRAPPHTKDRPLFFFSRAGPVPGMQRRAEGSGTFLVREPGPSAREAPASLVLAVPPQGRLHCRHRSELQPGNPPAPPSSLPRPYKSRRRADVGFG